MVPLLLFLLSQFTVHVAPNGYLNHHPTVEVSVHVDKDSHNRSLAVEVKGDNYYSISEKELAGDKAPTLHRFTFRSLPEGDYEVWAILVRWEDGKWKMQHHKAENLYVH